MNQINCLRCRHCRLIDGINIGDINPVIWCEKQQDRMPLNLSGSGIADPRPYKHGGDKPYAATAVEDAWFKRVYPDGALEAISYYTGRTILALMNKASKLGIRRSEHHRVIVAPQYSVESRRRTGDAFTVEQSKYIHECFDRDYWPRRGTTVEQDKSIRADILNTVNAMSNNDKKWTWRSITRHVAENAPSRKRKKS